MADEHGSCPRVVERFVFTPGRRQLEPLVTNRGTMLGWEFRHEVEAAVVSLVLFPGDVEPLL